MKAGSIARQFGYSTIAVLMFIGSGSLRAHAQSDHAAMVNMTNAPGQGTSGDDNVNALVKIVRESTERFKQVSVAEKEGYGLLFGCVSGSDSGAMGMHFVNLALVMDGELDARRPEIVIYEPLPDGRLRLIGADYLVLADAWSQKHPDGPPQLNGQLFHLFEAPNRFGLPAFYTLHVWAWKDNPAGTFVNWHSQVSCDAFSGERR